jgi:hypothetical protein
MEGDLAPEITYIRKGPLSVSAVKFLGPMASYVSLIKRWISKSLERIRLAEINVKIWQMGIVFV